MKYLALGIAAMTLAGCVSIPESEQALRANHYQVETKCSQLALKQAYEIIAVHTARCHGGSDGLIMSAGSTFVPVATEDKIHSTISAQSDYAKISVEHINPVAGGFIQLIEIQKTASCASMISVFKLNDSKKWKTAADSVFKWLEGDTESCFEMF